MVNKEAVVEEEHIEDIESENNELQRRQKLYADFLENEEVKEILVNRAHYMAIGNEDANAATMIWTLCERQEDPVEGCLFFIENFCWTYDPRSKHKYIPIVLFEFQKNAVRELIEHIENGSNILIEKSRDMGITWLVVYVFMWYWLFREGTSMLMGSYKEKLVDDGFNNLDSLFGKMDLVLQNLPKWILPDGFKINKHRLKLKLLNPENNNIITGDTMNPQFGRGARKTAIFYDELGFWDTARESWEAGADTTNCQIANSTPNGRNLFWKLRTSGMDVLSLHWRLHPLKDDTWYEHEKSRRTEEAIAQEIDLNYERSLEGRVYPEWEPVSGNYPYDPTKELYISMDFGKSDGTSIIWAQIVDRKLRIVDSYYKTGETIDFFLPFLTGVVSSEDYRYTKKEIKKIEEHREWRRGIIFGDPAGRFTSSVTDQSVFSIMSNAGLHVNWREDWKEFSVRKSATKMLVRKGVEINKNEDTEYFSMCIEQAAYPKVKRSGEDEVVSIKPQHNWTSHHRSALEYLALGLQTSGISSRVKVVDKFKKDGKTFNPYTRRRKVR